MKSNKPFPDQKPKILFVSNSSDAGGAALSLLSEVERLPRNRFIPLVVVPQEGPIADAFTRKGVQTFQIYQPWWTTAGSDDAWLYALKQLPKAVSRLRELIRSENVDLVWTNTSVIPAAALAAALESRPHVWRPHEFIGQGTVRGPLDAATIRGCIAALSSHIIAGSEILAKEFARDGLNARVSGVFSGIDCSEFADCSPDRNGCTILSIAATTPSKGLDDLVEAAVLLAHQSVDFNVVVVGGFDHESYRTEILKKLKRNGLADRFRLVGYQQELKPFLNRASLYCCPSHTEAMSRVTVEAMAAGLPIVATDCGGPRDLVQEGKTGFLVPVKDPEALAGALTQMLSDPVRRASLGEAGRRRASQLFDLKSTVPQLTGILEEAAHAPPASQAKPLAQLLMTLLAVGGPRILLGKKWRLLKPLIR